MAERKTKREYYAELREIVTDNADLVAFIDHEIELLDTRKTADRKPTKVQVENETFKASIVEYLTETDAPQTIKQIQAGVPELSELSNQKMTHLLSALVNGGVVTKTYEKKVPFYTIAQ